MGAPPYQPLPSSGVQPDPSTFGGCVAGAQYWLWHAHVWLEQQLRRGQWGRDEALVAAELAGAYTRVALLIPALPGPAPKAAEVPAEQAAGPPVAAPAAAGEE